LSSIWIGSVVSPVSGAWKLGDWHQFKGCDAEFLKVFDMRDYGIKCTFFCECPNVQFIYYIIFEVLTTPPGVFPIERSMIDNLRWTVNSIRLMIGCRIRPVNRVVESVVI
jgi:hypothetical protein